MQLSEIQNIELAIDTTNAGASQEPGLWTINNGRIEQIDSLEVSKSIVQATEANRPHLDNNQIRTSDMDWMVFSGTPHDFRESDWSIFHRLKVENYDLSDISNRTLLFSTRNDTAAIAAYLRPNSAGTQLRLWIELDDVVVLDGEVPQGQFFNWGISREADSGSPRSGLYKVLFDSGSISSGSHTNLSGTSSGYPRLLGGPLLGAGDVGDVTTSHFLITRDYYSDADFQEIHDFVGNEMSIPGIEFGPILLDGETEPRAGIAVEFNAYDDDQRNGRVILQRVETDEGGIATLTEEVPAGKVLVAKYTFDHDGKTWTNEHWFTDIF